MPPSPRYTVRLPHALDALVQARIATGVPFAVLIRDALSAYLADSPPTPPAPTPADSADLVHALGEQLAILRARVEALERVLTQRRHPADRRADRPADTPADSSSTGADTTQAPTFDPSKFILGTLCPRGHDYHGTGYTLRRLPRHVCPTCDVERTRERRQAKRDGRQ